MPIQEYNYTLDPRTDMDLNGVNSQLRSLTHRERPIESVDIVDFQVIGFPDLRSVVLRLTIQENEFFARTVFPLNGASFSTAAAPSQVTIVLNDRINPASITATSIKYNGLSVAVDKITIENEYVLNIDISSLGNAALQTHTIEFLSLTDTNNNNLTRQDIFSWSIGTTSSNIDRGNPEPYTKNLKRGDFKVARIPIGRYENIEKKLMTFLNSRNIDRESVIFQDVLNINESTLELYVLYFSDLFPMLIQTFPNQGALLSSNALPSTVVLSFSDKVNLECMTQSGNMFYDNSDIGSGTTISADGRSLIVDVSPHLATSNATGTHLIKVNSVYNQFCRVMDGYPTRIGFSFDAISEGGGTTVVGGAGGTGISGVIADGGIQVDGVTNPVVYMTGGDSFISTTGAADGIAIYFDESQITHPPAITGLSPDVGTDITVGITPLVSISGADQFITTSGNSSTRSIDITFDESKITFPADHVTSGVFDSEGIVVSDGTGSVTITGTVNDYVSGIALTGIHIDGTVSVLPDGTGNLNITGFLTTHPTVTPVAPDSEGNATNTFIQNIAFDEFGHATGAASGSVIPGSIGHSALSGLDVDDHGQYLTTGRGDFLYYRESDVDGFISGITNSLASGTGAGILYIASGDGVSKFDNDASYWTAHSGVTNAITGLAATNNNFIQAITSDVNGHLIGIVANAITSNTIGALGTGDLSSLGAVISQGDGSISITGTLDAYISNINITGENISGVVSIAPGGTGYLKITGFSGGITEEADPFFSVSVASDITTTNTANWSDAYVHSTGTEINPHGVSIGNISGGTFAQLDTAITNADLVKSGDNISFFNNDSGYINAHPPVLGAFVGVDNVGTTVIQSISGDSLGHMTGATSLEITPPIIGALATSQLNASGFIMSYGTGAVDEVVATGTYYSTGQVDSVINIVSGDLSETIAALNFVDLNDTASAIVAGDVLYVSGSNVTGFASGNNNDGKFLKQSAEGYIEWGIPSVEGGAAADAKYVTYGADAGLTDERVLTAGTGLSIVDVSTTVTLNVSGATTSVPGIIQLQNSATNGTTDKAITPGAVYTVSGHLRDDLILTGRNNADNISINSADISYVSGVFTGHTGNLNNPHAVTANQVGAYTVNEVDIISGALSGDIFTATGALYTTITSIGYATGTDLEFLSGDVYSTGEINTISGHITTAYELADDNLSGNLTGYVHTVSGDLRNDLILTGGNNSDDISYVSGALINHTGSKLNPHAVSSLQVGAYTIDQVDVISGALSDRLDNTGALQINYGGVFLGLGGNDYHPAFNLKHATGYPSSGLLTINDLTSGSILVNSGASWIELAASTSGTYLKSNGSAVFPSYNEINLGDLNDVAPTGDEGFHVGEMLFRHGAAWSGQAPGAEGTFLKSQGAGAIPVWDAAGGGGTLSGLTDTVITDPKEGSLLYWSGTQWIDIDPPNSVDHVLISTGQAAPYWTGMVEKLTGSSGWLSSGTLEDIGDVNTTGKNHGDLLVYDTGLAAYTNSHYINTSLQTPLKTHSFLYPGAGSQVAAGYIGVVSQDDNATDSWYANQDTNSSAQSFYSDVYSPGFVSIVKSLDFYVQGQRDANTISYPLLDFSGIFSVYPIGIAGGTHTTGSLAATFTSDIGLVSQSNTFIEFDPPVTGNNIYFQFVLEKLFTAGAVAFWPSAATYAAHQCLKNASYAFNYELAGITAVPGGSTANFKYDTPGSSIIDIQDIYFNKITTDDQTISGSLTIPEGKTLTIVKAPGATTDGTNKTYVDGLIASKAGTGDVSSLSGAFYTHAASGTVHFTEGSINHTAITNVGSNTHATIDTHIASTVNPHATDIGNLGGGTLAELNTAVTDATLDNSSASRPPNGSAGGDLGGTYPNPTVADGADGTAIHDNVAAEISSLTEKTTPVSADLLIIEDSAALHAKKKVQIGNLPSGGGGGSTDLTPVEAFAWFVS
jgi:hypothetical protein